ncbi:MAG: DoxX family membrane protein [Mucinivorans sp.]
MKQKILLEVSRWMMALLFIFSGLTKSFNTFGLTLQIEDYLMAMNMDFLRPLSGLGAILLPSVELLLGLMLVVGVARKITPWAIIFMMSFFTLLTFWIALYNPVKDCGCFGDVVSLSNWHTFLKNLLLLPFAVLLFLKRSLLKFYKYQVLRWVIILPLSCATALFSHFNLPLVDATPFKIGVNIPANRAIPVGAMQDEYHTVLLYKDKITGSMREFEIEDTQWHDSIRWEFVDSKSVLIKEGFKPPISDFPVMDSFENNVSSELLATTGKLLIVAATDLDFVDFDVLQSIVHKVNRVVILTSSTQSLPDGVLGVELFHSDYSFIHTLIQSRCGGAILLDNGTIIGKEIMRNLNSIM